MSPSTKDLGIELNDNETTKEFLTRYSRLFDGIIDSYYYDRRKLHDELEARKFLGVEIVHFSHDESCRAVSLIRHSCERGDCKYPNLETATYTGFQWRLVNNIPNTFSHFYVKDEEYIPIIGPSLNDNQVRSLAKILKTGDKEYKILQYTQTIDLSIPIA